MDIWLEYTKPNGRVIVDNLLDFNPIWVGIFADVPTTWNTAGRIYFYVPNPNGNILLGTDYIYLNYFHQAKPSLSQGRYQVLFQPVKYLKNYTIKIGY